ncbi:uncharacterized protein CLAFUR5_00811 [Fulvia fulva]|uniref:RRM domain-containing protein n=1 Tax=Passalora fulva TaxID=5499 RepID=A0A9Q8L772_PASFU|nr:uncharacterized protein CLAFUR5_00811 [Fulvia fulva]KAK4638168.1 hypothetical protein CLAFUR0_00810 [Fulvia fulva]UJO12112.1 hypothetical protein CLAFUR5_00811 [Fulvia fulva]
MGPARKKQRLSNGSAVTVEQHDDSVEDTPQAATETSAEAQEKAVQQKRSLFVRSLPPTATSETLTDLFSESYPIKHAVAVIDNEKKECKGYGFVTFADAEDAAKAKQEFNGHVLDGRKLRIEIAEPRQREGEGGHEKHGKKQEAPQQTKLIVRNLPWSIKRDRDLEKVFLSFGKVKKAYIPKKGPGLMAGFGFVVMRGRKAAEKAIEGVNGQEIDGRTLAVDWAVEKNAYQGAANESEEQEEEAEEAGGGVTLGGADEEHIDQDVSDAEEDGSEGGGSDEDEPDEEDLDMDEEEEREPRQPDDRSSTIFVRNLPFTCTDEDLEDHFSQFGSTRYARVVMDYGTERSKGTGFVCFYRKEDADACIRNAPARIPAPSADKSSKDGQPALQTRSILQNEDQDPTGQYTLDGRVVQVSRAVDKSEAGRLTEEGVASRYKRDTDKRRLYLLSEGSIPSNSKLWQPLPPSEQAMREASAKQRKALIESNPSLNLSLTRLSVRNLPRSIDSKALKQLAREAVVGFATDVKAGLRQQLSKEEVSRGGEEMREADLARKKKGKGIVKQAKVVFESAGGSKVSEETGAGRSRGYGFIEYYTHRNALQGLRWLNGHAIGYQVKDGQGKLSREDMQDRKKRLIVEFAIENAQVVMRRNDSEKKARERSRAVQDGTVVKDGDTASKPSKRPAKHEKPGSRKRKRAPESAQKAPESDKAKKEPKKPIDEKLARRNQIIGRKRAMRKNRKGGK